MYPIVIIIAFIIGFILIKLFKNMYENRLSIKATQNTYWGIDPKVVLENNKHKVVQKRGRKEIAQKYLDKVDFFYRINEKNNGEKILDDKALYMIRDFKPEEQLTKIKSLDYFKKDASELIKKVYNKIREFEADAELGIDFEEMLKRNDYYLEYFILEGWEKTAQYENIGVGTLQEVAKNKMEIKLIGAMDTVISSFLVYDAIELFAHFCFHHGRLKNI